MPVRNQFEMATAELAGRYRLTEWVKNVNQATTQGIWYDITGSAGNPRAKQWFDAAPLVAQQIKQSTDGGIYHGSNVGPEGFTKHLRSLRIQCVSFVPLPMSFILCDYLLYYPSIEDGNTDLQELNNTLTLPRYTTGAGVQMMAVTISARTGGQQFFVNYTNSDGVAGRVSGTVTQNTVPSPGTIVYSALNVAGGASPWIPLQAGDSGVRSVQSVQMLGPDTGFFAIVLVKPLATSVIRAVDAVYEKDFFIMQNEMTTIEDDAYLSLLVLPNGTLSSVAIRGNLRAVWN